MSKSGYKLKLHAWFYRRTGIFTEYAKSQQLKHLEAFSVEKGAMEDLVIGCWQVKHGFLSTMEQFERRRKFRRLLLLIRKYFMLAL